MVEDAHGALNAVGITPGVLARRAVEAGGRIARLEEELDDARRRLFKVALAAADPDRDHVDRCVDVDLIVGGSDRWRVGASGAIRKPGSAMTARDLEFAPPPWPLSEDPRTPACTHDWDGSWGEVGERQYRCKHCGRFIWHHSITDPDVPPFDPTAVVPTLRRRRTVRGDRR